jgi:hypothetical protein
MRILKFSLVCIMLTMFFLAQFVHAGACYITGNSLLESMRGHEKFVAGDQGDTAKALQFMGYVTGVNDTTSYMYGSMNNVSVNQMCAIATKYLKAHPEKWNECASDLVIEALKEAFPKNP